VTHAYLKIYLEITTRQEYHSIAGAFWVVLFFLLIDVGELTSTRVFWFIEWVDRGAETLSLLAGSHLNLTLPEKDRHVLQRKESSCHHRYKTSEVDSRVTRASAKEHPLILRKNHGGKTPLINWFKLQSDTPSGHDQKICFSV